MSRTILVIEDNPEMVENLSGILKLANYNVLTATEGKSGIDLAQQFHPDLILCDIVLPGLDGYSVYHILSKDEKVSRVPFIFVTAKSQPADIRFGMNLGADDYVTKPFDGHDLLKVIDTRLRKNALLRTSSANELEDVNNFFEKAREQKDLHALAENRPVRKFRKKEFVYMEGQTPSELFFVVEGEVKSFKNTRDGKELITGIFHHGDFFGYTPILENCTYTDCAMITEETEIAPVPREDFLRLIYSSKDVAEKFIRLLSNNLIEVENRLLSLAYQSVRQRVARILIHLTARMNAATRNPVISVSRKDIANIIGTATETLNRTLAEFKDEKLVDLLPNGILILNRTSLEKMSR